MDINPNSLREATGVTATTHADQIELQMGHLCNNRCVFCCSGQLSEFGLARQIAVEPVLEALEEAASRGIRKVTFLGGETTAQKSFLPALKRAVELGFSEVVIFTNGVTSANRSFVERIVAMGEFEWRFSIQGGTEEAHDSVTQVPGSFQRIIAGLTTLKELRQRVTANMCVNELSYRSLPHYPELIRQYDIRDLHIDMVRPAQSGDRTDEYLQSIIPRFSDMAPYIRQMLEGFEQVDPEYDVNVGNLPYCVLPEWSHKIHHGGQLTALRTPDQEGRLRTENDKYNVQWAEMVHAPQCEACLLRPDCRGVPGKYAQFYGFDELRPLSKADLGAGTRDGRVFVRIIDDLHAKLYAAEAPAPWGKAMVAQHSLEGLVEITWTHPGGSATFVISHPRRSRDAGGAIWETPHYRVSLRNARESAELAALVKWLHAQLRIPLQMRVASCVQRIRGARLSEGWSYRRFDPDVDSLGGTAVVGSDDGANIGIKFAADGDASLRVTFDIGTVEPVLARGVVENITAALNA